MDAYLKLIRSLAHDFDHFTLTCIPQSENAQADALATLASSSDPDLKRIIPVEFVEDPSIGPPVITNLIQEHEEDAEEPEIQTEENPEQPEYGCNKHWLKKIRAYIVDGKLPQEKWASRKIKTQAARYVAVDGKIYQWRLSGPLMTCIEGSEAKKVMEEIHSESCRNHSG